MVEKMCSPAENKPASLNWYEPQDRIWGFHCHMELPFEQFADALVIQDQLVEYLVGLGIVVSVEAAFEPGYGPHILHMWELRIESTPKDQVLAQLGQALIIFHDKQAGAECLDSSLDAR